MDGISKAIVTGASSGIGAAISKELCLRDIEVVAVARDRLKLEDVKKSLPVAKRPNFKPVVADMQGAEGIAKVLKASRPLDKVNLLINNAGIGVSKPFEQHAEADIERVISTNLIGTIMLTRGMLSGRAKKKPIRVVFVSSLAGKIGFPNLSIYSATKFALEGFAESLRAEYRDTSVKVSILRPGVTDTNFFKVAGMKEYQGAAKTTSMHSPSLVARTLLNNIDKAEIVVGGDKYFLKLLPFIPFTRRFNFLNVTNKLGKRG